jgi:uncharacterized membrane protein YjfL (UPF0719 family)
MTEYLKAAFNTDGIFHALDIYSFAYFLLAMVIFFLATIINNFFSAYSLQEELTKKDNKAVAVSFAAYIFSVAIIIFGIMTSESRTEGVDNFKKFLMMDMLSTLIWSLIGIFLLQAAQMLNDKLLLYKFSNRKELVDDRNVGTGLVQAGSYIGCALMVRASLSGDGETSIYQALFLMLLYFVIGQVAFILFGRVYQSVCGYDLHDEIERDNIAAGLSFGGALTGIGIALSGYIQKYDSLPGLFVWFLISSVLLMLGRYLVDKLILPGSNLKEEIVRDRNWGAAAIEAATFIGLAYVLISLF